MLKWGRQFPILSIRWSKWSKNIFLVVFGNLSTPPPFFLQRLLDIQPAAEPVAEGAADAHAALRVPRGRDRAQRVRDRGVRGVPREQHELLDPGPRDLRLGTRDVAARGKRALASDATVPVHRGVSDMLE